MERQLTHAPHGHLLTNTGVWSADGQWLVYDVRSDPAGSVFDGTRIERVHVATGAVEILYESRHGACCGVATCSPVDDRVVFIHGPEHPTPDWTYCAYHRRGVVVHAHRPGSATNLDACNVAAPFTAGALRGGTHLHTFSPDGRLIAFTYEDHVLAQRDDNQRNIGVSVPGRPVAVPATHSRNHDGTHFSVLLTRTTKNPYPGSDEICRACEEGWIDNRRLAFQGEVVSKSGDRVNELFLLTLPDDLTVPGDGPLAGTATHMPFPPRGTVQTRLTHTTERKYPGLTTPRHWVRSDPMGARLACLMRDDNGVAQLWTLDLDSLDLRQLTHNEQPITSAFTYSPDGRWLAHALDGSICVTDPQSGYTHRLTAAVHGEGSPRPEACVFSPDGKAIAYMRRVARGSFLVGQVSNLPLKAGQVGNPSPREDAFAPEVTQQWYNQIFVVAFAPEDLR